MYHYFSLWQILGNFWGKYLQYLMEDVVTLCNVQLEERINIRRESGKLYNNGTKLEINNALLFIVYLIK